MTNKKYQFTTTREQIITTGSTLVGLTIFGVGLCSVFNPAAIVLTGAYAARQFIHNARNFNKAIKDEKIEPVAENRALLI